MNGVPAAKPKQQYLTGSGHVPRHIIDGTNNDNEDVDSNVSCFNFIITIYPLKLDISFIKYV